MDRHAIYSGFFSANLLVGVVVDLHRGEATGDGADSLAQVENVKGSEFDDRIVGSLRSNVLLGSGGKDVIDGRGGPGRDTARVDARRDKVKSVAVLLR
jgi:hemolysin type calcium-binding protein